MSAREDVRTAAQQFVALVTTEERWKMIDQLDHEPDRVALVLDVAVHAVDGLLGLLSGMSGLPRDEILASLLDGFLGATDP